MTEAVKRVIRTTWCNCASKGDLQDVGLQMFMKLFEANPDAIALFRYDKNNPSKTTKLQNHVKLLFETIGMAVDMIDDLGPLTPVIIQLGSRHHHYGVKQEYYLVFGQFLIYALATALGKEFTEGDKEAGTTFYHWIGGCIIKGLSIESQKDTQNDRGVSSKSTLWTLISVFYEPESKK